jgi:hypothetical protein
MRECANRNTLEYSGDVEGMSQIPMFFENSTDSSRRVILITTNFRQNVSDTAYTTPPSTYRNHEYIFTKSTNLTGFRQEADKLHIFIENILVFNHREQRIIHNNEH